jgi:hypothetical protein
VRVHPRGVNAVLASDLRDGQQLAIGGPGSRIESGPKELGDFGVVGGLLAEQQRDRALRDGLDEGVLWIGGPCLIPHGP